MVELRVLCALNGKIALFAEEPTMTVYVGGQGLRSSKKRAHHEKREGPHALGGTPPTPHKTGPASVAGFRGSTCEPDRASYPGSHVPDCPL